VKIAPRILTSPEVGVMLPLAAALVPADTKRHAARYVSSFWAEVEGTDCRYGCKVYARRQGAVIRYAVMHSRTYGHPATIHGTHTHDTSPRSLLLPA
jgi:hypothetical protein